MKTSRKLLCMLLTLLMLVSLLPAAALADETPQVRVIVENTTYNEEDGAAWSGTLVDKKVDLGNDSTMMSCLLDALGDDHTQEGAESNYITELDGLAAGDGGAMSGWMGSLNDWFADEGFDAFTAASGKLKAGDEIRIMYTCDFGEDLGSSWSSNDKTVKAVAFSAGTLNKTFDKDASEYTLTVAADVTAVTVTPTASNKNFQVRTSVGSTEYQRSASVPVEDGTVITVNCGDPEWPSMNNGEYGSGAEDVAAKTYTFTVAKE